ncbi:translation factor [Sistotremastrum niveocremeum HHB9708]|uniref:Threonylcarbamoyl-AMP synthase n=1 Tax=Sistotremastrum niveocremeum HHB9708 TaxID=1314777 RepID=A0A164UA71_9AGAM|nr:translation factor [Sistotremastrum niveocremeum HHB9708]
MTRILRCNPTSISFSHTGVPVFSSDETREAIEEASNHIHSTHTPLIFPTETVYGLGASITDPEAISKIFSTKGRPPDNPLIVHISSMDMLSPLLLPDFVLPDTYAALIERFWPGPLALLFPANPESVPTTITAGHPTVAVRMPSHPVARALIAVSGKPLAAPSGNSSGKPSPTRVEHVVRDLGDKVELILDGGACGFGVESTVVDGLAADGNLRILRPGGLTVEDIEDALRSQSRDHTHIPQVLVYRRDYIDKATEMAPTTPGMKYKHYSPSVPVSLLMTSQPPPDVHTTSLFDLVQSDLRLTGDSQSRTIGLMVTDESPLASSSLPAGHKLRVYSLGSAKDLSVMARRLFDGFLTLESEAVDIIYVEGVEEVREGLAIMNRVRKAAGQVYWVKESVQQEDK